MDNVNNQRIVAFLEDLNVRLKRFDEMIQQAREDIMRSIAMFDAQRAALNTICSDSEAVMTLSPEATEDESARIGL